jgi:hypothetical protein
MKRGGRLGQSSARPDDPDDAATELEGDGEELEQFTKTMHAVRTMTLSRKTTWTWSRT